MAGERINIDGELYMTSELELLTGERNPVNVKDYVLLIAKVLQNPMRLPELLKEFCTLRNTLSDPEKEDMRMALLRVQIDSELRMHEDILRFQQRRYVAQVIEILIFKELLLAPKEIEDDIE